MPYLKRGGLEQYYRPILEAVDWRKESIDHYVKSKNVVFQKEGIVISGVSSRLAARYMPAGCFWDTNKAIGFYVNDNNISIEYGLGLLNSSLYNYLMKGIINNTNSIQLTGLHALPFISPTNELKGKVEKLVKKIIASKKEDLNYDYIIEQKEIDNLIYDFYGQKFDFPDSIKEKIDFNYSIY